MAIPKKTLDKIAKKNNINIPTKKSDEKTLSVANDGLIFPKKGKKIWAYEKSGRPTIMTSEVLDSIRSAYSVGATYLEACSLAKITKSTLYRYFKEHPDFYEEVKLLREQMTLLARRTVREEMMNKNNNRRGSLALDYLKAKKSDEFATKTSIELGISEEVKQLLTNSSKYIYEDTQRIIERKKEKEEEEYE